MNEYGFSYTTTSCLVGGQVAFRQFHNIRIAKEKIRVSHTHSIPIPHMVGLVAGSALPRFRTVGTGGFLPGGSVVGTGGISSKTEAIEGG